MKRIVSLVLALSMVLSMFTTSFAGTSLKDVEGTDYEAAVSALVELGIVSGYEDGTYQPSKVVTRAEMAKLLVISAGLEPAADVNKGATNFSDVAASHWASGYINVASQYGYINGYPDGSFAPDATVTYAEAVTMAIRVLGYKSVVEAKGTWPTNYIAKAQELDVLDDVNYDSYSDGAVRGNVALVIWNMLRTKVWDVQNENETDGLTYGRTGLTMIDKYFEDYTYTTVTFDKFAIDGDGKVQMYLNDDVEDIATLEDDEYEYLENDFYTYVNGTEVEVLVNEEDETLLMIVPTATHKVVDGAKDVIDDDYLAMSGDAYDYAYARVKGKTVNAANKIVTSSIHIDKLEEKDDYIKLNSKKYENDDWDSEVVLKDGKRVTLRDAIEVGDILTTVVVKNLANREIDTFYVIGGEEVEGEFDRLAEVEYENSELKFHELTIDGDKYVVDTAATYVEDPEAKTIKAVDLLTKSKAEMENEEVVVKLDPVTGKVVRVEFDGKIDSGSEDDTTVEFFGISKNVRLSDDDYTIGLENEKDEDTYKFARNSEAETLAMNTLYGTRVNGSFVAATLNDEGDVEGLELIAEYADSGDLSQIPTKVPYGEDSGEYFAIVTFDSASYDKDTTAIVNDADATDYIKVNDNTTLVTLVFDDKGTTKTTDDELRVEFTDDVTDVKAEQVIAIYDADESFVRAKYIVVFSDTSDNSENRVGKNASANEDALVGGDQIELEDEDGEKVTATVSSSTQEDLSDYELLVYTITTNSKGNDIFNFVSGLTTTDLNEATENIYVGECSDSKTFLLNNEKGIENEVDLTDDDIVIGEDTYKKSILEDYLVVEVSVTETDVEGQYEVSTFESTTYEAITLAEGDRLVIDTVGEVIYVISGMDLKEEEETTDDTTNNPTTYLVTWKSGDTELASGDVEANAVPTCPVTEDPAKADDDRYTYAFAGWSTNKDAVVSGDAPAEDDVIADGEEFPAVTADTTYYAIFTASLRDGE